MIIKSDQEPSLRDLVKAVKKERWEALESLPELSPVCEHESNREIEIAVQFVEGQMKSMRLALESR